MPARRFGAKAWQLARQAQQAAAPPTVVDLAASPALALLAEVAIPLPDLRRFAPLLEGVRA